MESGDCTEEREELEDKGEALLGDMDTVLGR